MVSSEDFKMETYRDSIIHSGVKGMKWGVWNEETRRRRTGGSPRKFQRELNKMDKQYAKEAAKQMQYTAKANKYLQKGLIQRAKGNTQKADSFLKKFNENANKANDSYNVGKELDKKSWQKMIEAGEAGNLVRTQQVFRDGRSTTQKLLTGGALGTLVAGGVYLSKYSKDGQRFVAELKNGNVVNQTPMTVLGVKYKVKKNPYAGISISTNGFYNG